jgi:hypothetical protein
MFRIKFSSLIANFYNLVTLQKLSVSTRVKTCLEFEIKKCNFTYKNYCTMRLLLFVLVFFSLQSLFGQIFEHKSVCKSNCKAAGDEMKNTKMIYGGRINTKTRSSVRGEKKIKFPLRIVIANLPSSKPILDNEVKNSISKLNTGFSVADMEFYIAEIENVKTDLSIEVLSDDNYALYKSFSQKHDKSDMISVFVFDYNKTLCDITPTSISCGRTGGFSYIISETTNNVVISRFDLEDDKILTHELGHFFGLYHTFEEEAFGKDNFVEDCNVAGDCLCDTPPDPGSVYEVYVNYSKCAMTDYFHENGNQYQPIINNYMGYYKPCYMKIYSFTNDQIYILRSAAESSLRKKFSR